MKMSDIAEFLKLNPQLKQIRLRFTRNIGAFIIFRSIFTHVPHIEGIQMDGYCTNDSTIKYVGKFNNLNTLIPHRTPCHATIHEFCALMSSVLNEIHLSNIPLEHLHLCASYYDYHAPIKPELRTAEQLINDISKLKTLKTLWLCGLEDLKMSHILGLCKNLKVLSELFLQNNRIAMSAKDILEIIKYGQNLQLLSGIETWRSYYYERNVRELAEIGKRYTEPKYGCGMEAAIKTLEHSRLGLPDKVPECIDAYMEMMQIVGQRRDRTRLLIRTDHYNSIAVNTPKKLIRKYSDILTLVTTTERSIYLLICFHKFNQ